MVLSRIGLVSGECLNGTVFQHHYQVEAALKESSMHSYPDMGSCVIERVFLVVAVCLLLTYI